MLSAPVKDPVLWQSWTSVGDHRVHSFEAGPRGQSRGTIVLLPGLGLPAYTRPTACALAGRGLRCVVLDLPGFGARGERSVAPDIHAIGEVAAGWVRIHGQVGPLVVMGHSTGAQAALTAALALQDERPDVRVVMAGPTFTPRQRRVAVLMAVTPMAYRRDSPRELCVLPQAARAPLAVLALLRSGVADTPEDRVRHLRVPLLVAAGRQDSYAPRGWLTELAQSAAASPDATARQLPGSHNNLFTHPQEVSALVAGWALP